VPRLRPSRHHALPLHERGRWYTFDARHNKPRIGRILIARGRDATDVAITTLFGPSTLVGFKVVTDEVPAEETVSDQAAAFKS
jgi:transglutaminase-like putative cysteine protease